MLLVLGETGGGRWKKAGSWQVISPSPGVGYLPFGRRGTSTKSSGFKSYLRSGQAGPFLFVLWITFPRVWVIRLRGGGSGGARASLHLHSVKVAAHHLLSSWGIISFVLKVIPFRPLVVRVSPTGHLWRSGPPELGRAAQGCV